MRTETDQSGQRAKTGYASGHAAWAITKAPNTSAHSFDVLPNRSGASEYAVGR